MAHGLSLRGPEARGRVIVPKGPSLSLRVLLLVIARVFSEAIFFIMPDSIKVIVIVMDKLYSVYIMTNKNNTVLYTGVTNNLKRRVYEHREKRNEGFTKKYNVTKLVYYEIFRDVRNAIFREKQIKGGSRAKKIELINGMNAGWKDLYDGL